MKKKLLILLIIMMWLLPSSSVKKEVDLSAEEIEAWGIAGLMTIVQDPKKDPVKPVVSECKCKNGKISYDGGTSWTDCPCKHGTSNCGCQNSAAIQEEVEETTKEEVKKEVVEKKEVVKELYPRIVLVTQPRLCAPCRKIDNNIVSVLKNEAHQKSGWKVGNTSDNNLQILDLDSSEDIKEVERLGLSFLGIPIFFKIKADGTIDENSVHEGEMSYAEFIKYSNAKSVKKN